MQELRDIDNDASLSDKYKMDFYYGISLQICIYVFKIYINMSIPLSSFLTNEL
jgi:hypothetical protein